MPVYTSKLLVVLPLAAAYIGQVYQNVGGTLGLYASQALFVGCLEEVGGCVEASHSRVVVAHDVVVLGYQVFQLRCFLFLSFIVLLAQPEIISHGVGVECEEMGLQHDGGILIPFEAVLGLLHLQFCLLACPCRMLGQGVADVLVECIVVFQRCILLALLLLPAGQEREQAGCQV